MTRYLSVRAARWVTRSLLGAVALCPAALAAQTDFYNTDRGRPLRVEDALVVERRAFELQAAPFTWERVRRGASHLAVAPEFAWGVLPRTQIELALPMLRTDDGVGTTPTIGLGGVELELLHQLNAETTRWPALALGAGAHLPVGGMAPSRTLTSVRGLATRTLGWGRVHLNATMGLGNDLPVNDPGSSEAARWEAGAAVDHTFFFRSLLVGADLVARRGQFADAATQWQAGVGIRQQVTPRIAFDAGLRRRVSAGEAGWTFTTGAAYAFAKPWRPAATAPARPAAPVRSARGTGPATSPPQWSTVQDQFYQQAAHNFVFRRTYPGADRLFNAFDFGHAILYETLWTRPDQAERLLEGPIYATLTTEVLSAPPRLPLVEDAIEPLYVRLAPEAKAMFEWAHILHRQVYDILGDERLSEAAKDAELQRLTAYYRSRPDLAFSALPKNMALMQEMPYSLAFRQRYPKFNGLIWAYHWLQVGIYEPLVVGQTAAERQAGVAAAVARFKQMIPGAPENYPGMMPMTAAIAPTFSAKWPTLAIIFDNLHSLHDVISDILANPAVPRGEKRALILEAVDAYRDDTTQIMTVEGWKKMSLAMGLENQGGPAVGFLPTLPTQTMPRGMVMRYDRDGNPIGDHHHHH